MFSMINSPDLYGSISADAPAPKKPEVKKVEVDADNVQMHHMIVNALDAIIRKSSAHEALLQQIEERMSSEKPHTIDINKMLHQYAPFIAIALMILVLFMCMRKGGQPMPYMVQSPHGVPFKLPTTFM
jgi:hypothetical protein